MALIKRLIYSAGRFTIQNDGRLYQGGNELKPVMKDGHLQVEIEWVDGKAFYPVARMVLLTFGKFCFSDHLWKEIDPLYIDGNPENLRFDNLLYRFKCGRLPAEEKVGFYHIPFHPGYLIDKCGAVWSTKTHSFVKWYLTKPNPARGQKEGYFACRLPDFTGSYRIAFKHRLVCLTFHPYDHRVKSLVVNHKDGVKRNCEIGNLELVTYGENNQHAIDTGLKVSKRPIEVKFRDGRPGMVLDSLKATKEHFGVVHDSFVYIRMIKDDNSWPRQDIAFRYLDGPEWPTADWAESVNHFRNHRGKRAKAICQQTGNIIEFTGAGQGSRLTGVNRMTILHHLRESVSSPTSGWVFELA